MVDALLLKENIPVENGGKLEMGQGMSLEDADSGHGLGVGNAASRLGMEMVDVDSKLGQENNSSSTDMLFVRDKFQLNLLTDCAKLFQDIKVNVSYY